MSFCDSKCTQLQSWDLSLIENIQAWVAMRMDIDCFLETGIDVVTHRIEKVDEFLVFIIKTQFYLMPYRFRAISAIRVTAA
ncbi:hypothetical protein TNCV_3700131 [Trichonephila clavipes]|nr:hypothetical protein TNCV_3700131 [Trichonephila clavipes]